MSYRVRDIVGASVGLVATAPLLVAAAVAIKLDSPGPAFFRQSRVGLRGQQFLIHKLRTMRSDTTGPDVSAAGDARITRVGKVLRRTKIDELPQLWDVLRGKMSLVGPRPELPQYVDHWPPSLKDTILSVRPGITDPASILLRHEDEVLARSASPRETYLRDLLPQKARIYAHYATHRTLVSDSHVLLRTLVSLVTRPGPIASGTQAFPRDTVSSALRRRRHDSHGARRKQTSDPQRKVLVVANHDTGLYNTRKELVTSLLDRGDDVTVAYPGGSRAGYFVEKGANVRCVAYDRHSTNPLKDLRLLLSYRRLIRDTAPDVVLTFTIKPNIYAGLAARTCGVPFVANVTGMGSAASRHGLLRWIVLTLLRSSLSRASTVFVQNQENLELLVSAGIVNRDPVLLPGSGVNLNEFRPEAYPTEQGVVRLLYLGRIQRDKGIVELAEVANYFRETQHRVQFEVAGFRDDDVIPQFEDAVASGALKFHGNAEDVRPLIRQASAVIHPSHHEGLSNVLLEAAAMARPVLASNIPGCRETLEEGVTGLTFSANSTASMRKTILRFLEIPRAERCEMGRRGRHKMVNEFDRQKVVAAYATAIDVALE